MSKLDDFIEDIELFNSNEQHDSIYTAVVNMYGLLAALKELRAHVGNEKIKDLISGQTRFLIRRKYEKDKGLADDVTSKPMLNICIYGGPGIGKTTLAKILGKIIVSVGSIKGSGSGSKIQRLKTNAEENQGFILLLVIIIVSIGSLIPPNYILLYLFLAFILMWWLFSAEIKTTLVETHSQNETGGKVILAGKTDFIASYLGQTGPKTKAFLENARGSVVIVDEAYQLVPSTNDIFGTDALTEINVFLSENPESIAIIFAGYKDKIESSVFEAQPGLERRFMWHYDCEPYTSEELMSIFEIQLKNEGLLINPKDRSKIQLLINTTTFDNQAGDTERLAYMSAMSHNLDDGYNKFISYEHVNTNIKNIASRKQTKLSTNTNNYNNTLEELLSRLHKNSL